jgi:hypothetical protein
MFDVSLATFYVFDKENESQLGQRLRLAAGCRGGGCGGGHVGWGCGIMAAEVAAAAVAAWACG